MAFDGESRVFSAQRCCCSNELCLHKSIVTSCSGHDGFVKGGQLSHAEKYAASHIDSTMASLSSAGYSASCFMCVFISITHRIVENIIGL